MARMPGVEFLGIKDNGVMSAHDIVCVHTIVGYQAGGNAAHFTTGASGKIVQARDTVYKSAANLNGNYRVIAIENEDHGPAYGTWSGSDVPRFTAAQAESIAKILVWAHDTHGIPLTLIPDSKPGRRGIAYHRQGIDPWRVEGGELWTSYPGKVCPGDRRIAQLINEIIPRARQLAGQTSNLDGDNELDSTQAKQLDRVDAAIWEGGHDADGTYGPLMHTVEQLKQDVAAIRVKVDAYLNSQSVEDLNEDRKQNVALVTLNTKLDEVLAKLNGSTSA